LATLPPVQEALGRLRQPPSAAALIVYLCGAGVLLGQPLLHPGDHACLCVPGTTDAGVYVWAMEWWPHAIAHGLNPLHSDLIYAPEGMNLAHGALVPAAGLIMAPVTAVAGPLFSFNLAMFLSPVLAAFFAFLLCRRLTSDFWASLFGGWVFGFSTYMFGQLAGHLNLVLVFLVPAMVHLVLRGLAGEVSRRRLAVLLTGALVLQFLFSVEVFATFTLFAAIALAAGWLFGGQEDRRRLRATVVPIGLAYAGALIVMAPYVYYLLKPGALPVLPERTGQFSNDLLGFVVPTQITHVGGLRFLSTTNAFTAGFVEGAAYLGLPLLLLALLGARRGHGHVEAKVLAAMLGVAMLLSLGAHLHVRGSSSLPLPWAAVNHLPVFGQMLPARFVMFASLAAGLLAALWLAQGRARVLGWLLALLSVATLWPAVGRDYWQSRLGVPDFFAGSAWRDELRPRDTVLVLPVGIAGQSMLYHAETGLGFRMASGYVVPPEASDPYKQAAIHPTLTYGMRVPGQQRAAASFVASNGITVAVMDANAAATSPWPGILQRLGWDARTVAGALVMRPAGRVPPPVTEPPPAAPRAAGPLEAQRAAQATAAGYLRAFAAGDAEGFCALLTSRAREFQVQQRGADRARCVVVMSHLLRRATALREAARSARVGPATIGAGRGHVAVLDPAGDVRYFPVRRIGGAWLIDGMLQAPGPAGQ